MQIGEKKKKMVGFYTLKKHLFFFFSRNDFRRTKAQNAYKRTKRKKGSVSMRLKNI